MEKPESYVLFSGFDGYESLMARMTHSRDETLLSLDRGVSTSILLQDIRAFFAQRRDKQAKNGQAKALFRAALHSGREEYVNEMVHQMHIWSYLSLPETIDEVIRPIPFSARFSSKDYIIPGRREEVFSLADLIESVKGGNVRIVMYIREHCSKRDIRDLVDQLYASYIHGSDYGMRNPQGFYSILQ
ncbi:hypothetical protein BQ9231_00569 [Cedratvirus lausannensis]|uniref:Uncharacterized protein n=1 Tax=Cedratvirus lausannensis TaxID=2023205 RepID=A0A285PZ09_9VIRU|nr:hypothetical protein BQ9231_00569 [Cedratvirus lausannensis]